MRDTIRRVQRLAAELIERARQAVVAAIRRVGDALIAIGDVALAAFPEARERFRREIRTRVAQAEAAVNRLANRLREGIQRALDFLGRALDAALGLLERGLMAVVDAVRMPTFVTWPVSRWTPHASTVGRARGEPAGGLGL